MNEVKWERMEVRGCATSGQLVCSVLKLPPGVSLPTLLLKSKLPPSHKTRLSSQESRLARVFKSCSCLYMDVFSHM